MLTRGADSNGNRGDGSRDALTEAVMDTARYTPADGAEAVNEAALGAWVCAALLGVALGLGVAKYAQAWARTAFHPTAILGALMVLISVGVTLAATTRYLDRAARLAYPRVPPRMLATFGLVLVSLLAWIALAIIAFAGWEFPPTRQGTAGGGYALDRPILLTGAITLERQARRARQRHGGGAIGRSATGAKACPSGEQPADEAGACPPHRQTGAVGARWWTPPRGLGVGVLVIALAALFLAGCGQVGGTPTPNRMALPPGELGCFQDLRVIPTAVPPGVTQAEAEGHLRAASTGQPRRLGNLLSARAVTVLATEGQPALLGGRDVWLLVLESFQNPDWPVPPSSPTATRTFALVDARTGNVWGACVGAP